MAIIRIIYLAIVLGTGLFVILYVDSLALLWFWVMCLLPLLLLLMLLLARILTKITVEIPTTEATVNQTVPLRFCVKNMSLITLAGARARIFYKNLYTDTTEKTEFIFPINAVSKQVYDYEISSNHIGVVKIKIKDIVLYDFFRLFSIKVNIDKEVEISFLPKIYPTDVDIRRNKQFYSDLELYSKVGKGDDTSEVFNIREFVPGDKLNRIHWKLSGKNETLMVKEYSNCEDNNILILLDLSLPKVKKRLEAFDAVVSIATSISCHFCERQLSHSIAWFDSKSNEFYCNKINNIQDIYSALRIILSSSSNDKNKSLLQLKNTKKRYSHIAYISAMVDKYVFDIFNELPQNIFYTVFDVTKNGDTKNYNEEQYPQIYTVPYNGVEDVLSFITL